MTQDFNTLSATNPSPNTNTVLPPGFGFVEAGKGLCYLLKWETNRSPRRWRSRSSA